MKPKVKVKYVPKNPGTGEYWTVEVTEKIFTGPDCYTWREVFAWLPVRTITGQLVWGQRVYKQRFWAIWGRGFHLEPEVEYATFLELLSIQDTDLA